MTAIVTGCTAAVAANKTVQTIVNTVSCSRKSWLLSVPLQCEKLQGTLRPGMSNMFGLRAGAVAEEQVLPNSSAEESCLQNPFLTWYVED